MQTITVGDYSIEYEIRKEAYDWFLANIYPYDVAKGISPGKSLKNYLKTEIEKLLTVTLREKKTDPENDNITINEVKIADISFAFNNAELVNLLRTRGSHIMY